MDERRARLHDDLLGMIRGEILLDPLDLAAYSVDASLYEIEPLAVIVPSCEEDVVQAVRYASEYEIPIQARGAGTGVSGGVLGSGITIDFSRHLRRVIRVEGDRVTVQPGVVPDALNRLLAPLGRRLGPDPEGSAVGTLGGMIGLDSAGPSALRYGSIGDHVDRLKVVFANGETAEVGHEFWPGYDAPDLDYKTTLVRRLGSIVRHNLDVLVRRSPFAPGSRSGYSPARAATGIGIHLPKLLVGSEGTLALITEITVRTVPIPPAQAVLSLPFSRLLDAASEVSRCLDASPVSCELFDWRTIRLAREAHPFFRESISDAAESILVLRIEGEDQEEVVSRAGQLGNKIARGGKLVADAVLSTKRGECEQMLKLRSLVEPSLMRMKGRARPLPFIDDAAVPPERVGELIRRIQSIMRRFDTSWTLHANAGQGQVHTRPFLDPSNPSDVAKIEPMAIQVYEAAWDLDGAVSSENGLGLVRTQFVKRQFGEMYPVLRQIKDLCSTR